MKKILLVTTSIILFVVVAVIVLVMYFSKRSLPQYNGDLVLKNMNSQVEVYFDDYGIPHIIADNEEDLYRVAGYITARDRIWQMDLIRRATQGRLSEIFGKSFVKTDLMLRALEIPDKSEKVYENLDSHLKTIINAYADGINQYLEQYKKKLPLEFVLLGYKPDKWLPQNSLNLIGYMAWDLETAWEHEFPLIDIYQKFDSSMFKIFVPNFDSSLTICNTTKLAYNFDKSSLKNMSADLLNLGIVPFMGSNNWAVSGIKTKSRKPILCNDMHLGFSIPGIWYQMQLIIPRKMNVTGVSIPGAPGIISGHNDSIAWGMTNVMLDGADFYAETLSSDSTKYFLDGNWYDIKVVAEKIVTKEGDTINEKLLYTEHGPIISRFKNIKDKAVSMRWIGYELSDEFKGLYLINNAHNWNDFLQGVRCFGSVSQNFVYSDTKGNIGMQISGLVPQRAVPGYYLVKGDTSLYDWKGFVPFDSLPSLYNPKDGYVASANNKSSNSVNYYITQFYFQDYRYGRITELLAASDSIDVDYMKMVQNDFHSKLADEISPKLLENVENLKLNDKDYKKIVAYLKDWNHILAPESIAAMFFEQFNMLFIKNSVSDELGDAIFSEFDESKILMNNILEYLWKNEDTKLFDNVNTKEKEDLQKIVDLTYKQTVDSLTKYLGKNVDNWNYNRIHTLTLVHPLSKVKVLDLLFNLNRGPFGVGGSNHTVCPYSYPLDDESFTTTSGASERHIFDLNHWDNSLTVIPTGESGQSASQYYCNQTEKYIANQYHKDIFSIENVKKLKQHLVIKSR